MFRIFQEVISDIDKFDYVPKLGYKAKQKQGTVLGGVFTILVGLIIFYILGDQLHLMG